MAERQHITFRRLEAIPTVPPPITNSDRTAAEILVPDGRPADAPIIFSAMGGKTAALLI